MEDRHANFAQRCGGSTLNTWVTDNFGKLKYKQRKFPYESQLSNVHRTQILNFVFVQSLVVDF